MNLFNTIKAKNERAMLHFEMVLFNNAASMIEGYNGGQWTGNDFLFINDSKRVRLIGHGNGCDVETDMRSASVAVCILTLNHAIWHYAEKGNNDLGEFFDDLWRAADSAYAEDETLDQSAIYAFLD